MRFTPYYRVNLNANGKAKAKHLLRQHLHEQPKGLWNQPPLNSHRYLFKTEDDEVLIVYPMGNFEVVPVESSRLSMVADLSITLLRPEPPGSIVTQGGDMANRLKTLLDALRVSQHPKALPMGAVPAAGESPFFCLLEDDNLITGLNVKTDRRLDRNAGQSEVVLPIRVRPRLAVGPSATSDSCSHRERRSRWLRIFIALGAAPCPWERLPSGEGSGRVGRGAEEWGAPGDRSDRLEVGPLNYERMNASNTRVTAKTEVLGNDVGA